MASYDLFCGVRNWENAGAIKIIGIAALASCQSMVRRELWSICVIER